MAISMSNTEPGIDCYVISPSDSVDLPFEVRAIRATGAGNVVVETPRSREIGGTSTKRTLAFLAGETRIVRAVKVWSTSTTATGLEGIT